MGYAGAIINGWILLVEIQRYVDSTGAMVSDTSGHDQFILLNGLANLIMGSRYSAPITAGIDAGAKPGAASSPGFA